jgi:hypothetical protein
MVKASRKEIVKLKKVNPAMEASLKDMEPMKWIGKAHVCGGVLLRERGVGKFNIAYVGRKRRS